MENDLPLTALPRALIEAGYDTPSYRFMYERAVSAKFPAKKNVAGRWTFREEDIPKIAEKLGLKKV